MICKKKISALALGLMTMFGISLSSQPVLACTRILYVGEQNMVATGRNMDWKEDMKSDLWIFPRGMVRNGLAGSASLNWESRYGSVITSGYGAGSTDGMNEKGLVANLLFLVETDYGKPSKNEKVLALSLWLQYFLDNYATVSEAVAAQQKNPLHLVYSKIIPNGSEPRLHLSVSDSTGDSAIFEYVDGKLNIYHGREYKVLTNSPVYNQQLAINNYWKEIGGFVFLPGTNKSSDRFARASFYLDAIPKKEDPNYISGVPGRSYDYQAVAQVMSISRAVSVPLGISIPDKPNLSSTIWRTISDQKNRIYYFDSATRPNVIWVAFDKVDFRKGAPVKKLDLQNNQIYSGEVSSYFNESKPLMFMDAL
ncbi:linear amide C-N hydrolase [Oxalobacter formigenes]|uniref:Linear amide C-N hydrolase, choloylglycine hydrolase family protein n=1 Tax=Oxalobacter formigenes OXCC13 TaxID=556269 RepID=C3XB10_OXAFO|nr:linear amide C-N hydrolase [Oxalobacter formigenes]ARQ45454.1 Choloylglycine hydrolase [Oxalobacter formigenes]EEO30386.1 linear amide C-N hydrolase, choloylglycine hydrolase family protein [Oxalobacter formigenes OXCC13]MCZ4061892.1 linear amide C-N hydrolase [Oxalobacter formigenes]WAW02120.1 linear amide C-N hydrolase [Oxalobacter formigenes]WAW04455.1 linear amide C-N hydrolase [Oxalobacter formigenes]